MLSIDNNILTTAYTGVMEVSGSSKFCSSESDIGDVVQLCPGQSLVNDGLGNPSLKI